MLDILRRHAKSWLIKLPIIAIIISFAFFFGYSAMRKGSGDEDATVATVNGEPVSTPEFKYYLDNSFERLRQSFKDKQIPDFVAQMAQSTALRQTIARELMLRETNNLGIVVPDDLLANIIRNDPMFQRDGAFDPIFYRRRFLPHFKNRYGMDFEKFMRRDLQLETFKRMFAGIDSDPVFKPGDEGFALMDTWSFGVVEIEPKKLIEAKSIERDEDAKIFAAELIETPPKRWKSKLGKFKLEEKKVGPITVSERARIMGTKAPLESMNTIFKLTEEESVVKKPIEFEDKLYVVRLIEKKKLGEAKSQTEASPFFQMWMSKLLADAKVKNFLNQEQQ